MNRKLQSDIDRTLKKVGDGVEEFEEIREKVYGATNSNQREKHEMELKRSIKKLQRMRDQIKTWITMNEIKDKRQLLDARRLIEVQMERYRACEKDSKNKNYSKEGNIIKPEDKRKVKLRNWIQKCLDDLKVQTEQLDSEMEVLTLKLRKAKKPKNADIEESVELETRIERHQYHTKCLEIILRRLENDELSIEDVMDIKDSVDGYIENNTDPEFYEDEEVYERLGIELGAGAGNEASSMPSMESASVDHSDKDANKTPTPYAPATTAAKSFNPPPNLRSPPLASQKPPAQQSPAKGKKATPASQEKPAPTTMVSPRKKQPSPQQPSAAQRVASTAPPKAQPPVTASKVVAKGGMKQAETKPQKTVILPSQGGMPVQGGRAVPAQKPPAEIPTGAVEAANRMGAAQPPSKAPVQLTDHSKGKDTAGSKGPASQAVPKGKGSAPAESARMQYPQVAGSAGQMGSAERPNRAAEMSPEELEALLAHSYGSIPEMESEPDGSSTSSYKSPSYYPQHPSRAFDDSALYRNVEIDVLFFIFFYRQGTYHQHLAAKELMYQLWRYHRQSKTWFQRHGQPKTLAPDYEYGVYHYFDYNGNAWGIKKKEFKFEYAHLTE
mmetsp:Transcript_15098/g.42953  ORF Transcript_15098/g.42953 Transcript_15098/m.42953 type:complete len:611 (-) Transcript_15098:631-2463(-)